MDCCFYRFLILIILRPGFNEINFASISALLAGIIYALFLIYTRKLSFTDSPLVTLIFTGFVGTILISLVIPFYWINMNLNHLFIIVTCNDWISWAFFNNFIFKIRINI